MRFVDHSASSAFARDTQEACAVGARRVHVVIDQGAWRVADPESGACQPRRHLGFLFVAGRSRSEALVEEPDAGEGGGAKRHVGAQYAANLDNFLAVVDDREVEPYGGLDADLGRGILGRQDAPLHRGEFGMLGEKPLDLVQVVRRGDEVVVKAYDYVALGIPYGDVLDSAFAGTRVVQMLERGRRRGQNRRRRCAVFSQENFARSSARRVGYLGRQAVEQAFERVGTRVGRDYDRELQNNFLAKTACQCGVRAD